MHDQDMRYSPPCEGKNNSMSMRITWFILTEKNMGNDIAKNIVSTQFIDQIAYAICIILLHIIRFSERMLEMDM